MHDISRRGSRRRRARGRWRARRAERENLRCARDRGVGPARHGAGARRADLAIGLGAQAAPRCSCRARASATRGVVAAEVRALAGTECLLRVAVCKQEVANAWERSPRSPFDRLLARRKRQRALPMSSATRAGASQDRRVSGAPRGDRRRSSPVAWIMNKGATPEIGGGLGSLAVTFALAGGCS